MNVIQYGMRRNDMPIIYNEKTREFHLYNQEISYIIKILDNDQPGQLYYGKRLTHKEDFSHLFEYAMRDMSPYAFEGNSTFSLENIRSIRLSAAETCVFRHMRSSGRTEAM